MSLYRNFHVTKISEAFNVQFRANSSISESYEFPVPWIFKYVRQNNSVFNADGSALPTALNQTSTSSRQIQFGLKLVW